MNELMKREGYTTTKYQGQRVELQHEAGAAGSGLDGTGRTASVDRKGSEHGSRAPVLRMPKLAEVHEQPRRPASAHGHGFRKPGRRRRLSS